MPTSGIVYIMMNYLSEKDEDKYVSYFEVAVVASIVGVLHFLVVVVGTLKAATVGNGKNSLHQSSIRPIVDELFS